ncbi:alpha/beta hydrolase [Tabrizicola sp.]|uniref:alpha/beta hydrolase n=1 Tax=Tabrizicola sp. TaxID=2005166 RepID=UPI00286BC55F|nr:alpha/beta hydrolase [Tabrizicola sp.]
MDYVFCARNTSGGQFGDNAGPTKYLEVPETAAIHTPAMAIAKSTWFAKVAASAEVRRTEAGAPIGDVLIYIHGFNTNLRTVLHRHRLLRKGLEALDYKGAVVSFDWPSADVAVNYLEDRTDAKLTAIRLVTDGIGPFTAFLRQDCEISVHVLAHSMGAFVLREALDDADDRKALVTTGWSLSQVMICSGDVSADSMGSTAVSASLYRHCIRLTNYSNPYDAVLSISNAKRVGVSPRVGRIGLPASAPSKSVNVNVGIYYDEHREDFAGITNADHSFYFSSPQVLKDIHLTIQGEIDRASIPTRLERDGKLYLRP